MTELILKTGELTNSSIRYIGQLAILSFQTIVLSLTLPFKGMRSLMQANRIGPGSFLISSMVAFFIGMIIALQMAYQMMQMSAELLIPKIIAVALTRELVPVLTALIVAGRIGAGIAAEIGSMTVTEQVDALRAFAVNPVSGTGQANDPVLNNSTPSMNPETNTNPPPSAYDVSFQSGQLPLYRSQF